VKVEVKDRLEGGFAVTEEDVDSLAATFNGQAKFSSATFSGDAGFGEATFNGDIQFDRATHRGRALNPAEQAVPQHDDESDPG
jgi:hypothetical protein